MNVMKFSLIALLFLLFSINANSQIISGKIIDSESNEPLEYASIGIVNTTLGTITDENGNFMLEAKGQDLSSILRISMIGFKSQSFTIEEIYNKDIIIELVETPIEIAEVIIRLTSKERKVGITGFSKSSGWSG
ncbi:MAG: carboxypeptidase-like regulatory domain-containing protein [Bacteroidales bacterium]|nr:carboxypeptidase-like regulatory domain-containing protein [Bacteroidales bacterium]